MAFRPRCRARSQISEARNRHRPQIQVLNVENKQQRFPPKDDILGPPIAAWRSNLAASSQRRNLVFTAHGEDIYVWVPNGPLQMLGSQAAMIIKPVMKEPGRPGYISPRAPHTINNIIVDELGRDEVLVLVTDSGNVCAYHVEAIFSTVNRHANSGNKRSFDGVEADLVSPFLVENVEQSAWGLAIHKFARLIAVSANTGQITVFAFALVDSASTDEKNDSLGPSDTMDISQSDQTWLSIENGEQLQQLQKLMPHHHRSQNLRLTYRGHFDNIPSVSFANFDLDAGGTWMVSTDIGNKIIIWKIWEDLWPWETYYPGHSAHDPPERGWTVIPLDPRTFRDHHVIEDACGCTPKTMLLANRVILDVSNTVEGVPDASQGFVANETKILQSSYLPDDLIAPDCCIYPMNHCGNPENVSYGRMSQSQTNGEVFDDDGSDESTSDNDMPEEIPKRLGLRRTSFNLFEEENEHFRVPPRLFDFYEDPSEETLPQGLQNVAIHPICPVFFPVLHLSERHITLAPYPMNAEFDVLCRSALIQEHSFVNEMSIVCDRFNLVKYVPELGLVIAASQKGRVAIISLTRHQEIGYSFRIDWILPFSTQEQIGERPRTPLLGIAVSPMPGFEVPPDIPSIPRGVDPQNWVEFNYRILNPDDENPSPSSSSSAESEQDPESMDGLKRTGTGVSQHDKTLPEIHAQASRAHRPNERWHGWHPSRHYRLLLLYCDHTVMSYEFWHDWKH